MGMLYDKDEFGFFYNFVRYRVHYGVRVIQHCYSYMYIITLYDRDNIITYTLSILSCCPFYTVLHIVIYIIASMAAPLDRNIDII